MAEFTIGDTDTRLRVTCLRRNGSIFTLTDYTVALKFRIGGTIHSAVSMNIVDALGGRVEYRFLSTDLSEVGTMYCEIEVTEISTGRVTSSAVPLIFTVRGKVI